MLNEGQKLDAPHRLADLNETGLLEVLDDSSFQRFIRLAARMLKVPVSLVSLVTDDRQHFVGSLGLPEEVAAKGETPLSHSFCQHVVKTGKPLLVSDAKNDPRVCDNLAVPDLGVEAYLGVPIVSSRGNILGSFCVIDGEPRKWKEDEVLFMEDLREAVCSEIELRRHTLKLKGTVEELEKAHAHNDEMVHMIIHDLRNPLAGIQGGLDLLRADDDRPEEDEEILSVVGESCEQMMDLIGDILESNKIQNTRLPLAIGTFDVNPLLREIERQTELLARSRSIEICWDQEDCPDQWNGDRRLLKRVLQNLLINALKFTPPGGNVSFSVSAKDGGETIAFRITDSGPGVAVEERDTIFGKFFVGKVASSRSIGLGLTFCRRVCEAHGGEISLSEGPNQRGSTFLVELPKNPRQITQENPGV